MSRLITIVATTHRLLSRIGTRSQPALLLLLRLYFGFGFARAGWGKLANPDTAAADFRSWGVPTPDINVYAAGLTELLCGIALALGVLSRITALPLIGVMIVAYLTAHRPEVFVQLTSDFQRVGLLETGFSYNKMLGDFVAAAPFMYLVTCLLVLCFGPGKLSVDHAVSQSARVKRLNLSRESESSAADTAGTT